jgi:putative flippase GtrA
MIRFLENIKNKDVDEFRRYFFVGLFCAILDIFIFYFLTKFFGVFYLISSSISFIISTTIGYFLQRKFVFKNYHRNHVVQLPIFFLISIIGIFINGLFMYIFIGILGFWFIISIVLTKGIVLFWNYLANKHITFKSIK